MHSSKTRKKPPNLTMLGKTKEKGNMKIDKVFDVLLVVLLLVFVANLIRGAF